MTMTDYHHTLIDVQTLQSRLGSTGWVIVDCRFNLFDTEAGRTAYNQGHIPGARYAHLDEDLSSPVTASSGRHPLPDVHTLTQTLGGWGVADDSQVVAYDDSGGATAARLWWLLRWLGFNQCAVLDGGIQAWQAPGYEVTSEVPQVQTTTFTAKPNHDLWMSTAAIVANLNSAADLVIDARANIRYRGEKEPIDPVAGHIPGAINLPLDENLRDGLFLPTAELRQRFQTALQQHNYTPEQVIHMCGSGVTACHNMLAMEVAGLTGSRIYVGSWSEWVRDASRPIATAS